MSSEEQAEYYEPSVVKVKLLTTQHLTHKRHNLSREVEYLRT